MGALVAAGPLRQHERVIDHRFIVLLRGVNVGAARMISMAALRTAIAAAGYPDVATYVQSGNLIFTAAGPAAAIEATIESLIARDFGMKVEAIARPAADFTALAAGNPFPDAEPKLLHLCLTKQPLAPDAVARLAERAAGGERIRAIDGGLWIDFADAGVARSKLTPAFLDKAAGSTLTARNWNTVRALVDMAGA